MSSFNITPVFLSYLNSTDEQFHTARMHKTKSCDHADISRPIAGKKIEEFNLNRDQLKQSLVDLTTQPNRHPVIKQIDEWERHSIEKIQKSAEDARKQLRSMLDIHLVKMTQALSALTMELNEIRNDEDFAENKIQESIEKVDKLKRDLFAPQTINFGPDDSNPHISKIFITGTPCDYFERSAGKIRIEGNGQIAVHDHFARYATVRGRGEYSVGIHRFCFTIENLNEEKWIFFGIVSKLVPIQCISVTTHSVYGWAGENFVCRDGINHPGFNGYKSDMQINDTIELIADCNRRTIRLINKRTESSHQLSIDTVKCPFPWQINLCFYYQDDRVRVLLT